MKKKWWRGLNLGKPGVSERPAKSDVGHLERCPFCGEMFDMRDLGQVLEHDDQGGRRCRLST
jgi:hypothetical protein